MRLVICRQGGWRLTPLFYKTFYAKQGIDCYCYQRRSSGDDSYKYESNEYTKYLYYYEIDKGDIVKWEDIEKMPRLSEFKEEWRYDPLFMETLKELGDSAYADGVEIRILEINNAEYELEKRGNNIYSQYYYEIVNVTYYV